MRANPILKKELVLGARSIRFPLALMAYSGILAFISLLTLEGFEANYRYSGTMNFNELTYVFLILAFVQLFMICVIIPVLTAGSIAGERERQTLDIMLTAPVSPVSIVFGKLFASLFNVLLFVISSLPAMAIAFLYGGIQWQYLLIFLAAMMVIAFLSGAIGVWSSAVYKKTIISVIMTILVEFLVYAGVVIAVYAIYAFKYNQMIQQNMSSMTAVSMGHIPALLFLSPVVGFVDALCNAYMGTSGVRILLESGSLGRVHSDVVQYSTYCQWIGLAMGLVLGLIFIFLAARKIDSVHRKEKHRKKTR